MLQMTKWDVTDSFSGKRDSSPVSSEFSDVSPESTEFFSSNSEAGSYVDSDVLSISSECSSDYSLRGSSKSRRQASTASKVTRTSKKRKAGAASRSASVKRKKACPSALNVSPNNHIKVQKATATNSTPDRIHRRKKLVPVKVISPSRSNQINLFSRGINHSKDDHQDKPVQDVIGTCVRKSPRFSLLPATTTKTNCKFVNLKHMFFYLCRNVKQALCDS